MYPHVPPCAASLSLQAIHHPFIYFPSFFAIKVRLRCGAATVQRREPAAAWLALPSSLCLRPHLPCMPPNLPRPCPSRSAHQAGVSGQPLSAAAEKYRSEIWDSLKALWMVWVPAQVRTCTAGCDGMLPAAM